MTPLIVRTAGRPLLISLAAIVGCVDDPPSGPGDTTRTTDTASAPVSIVSNPLAQRAGLNAPRASAASSSGPVVFVSLQPGTVGNGGLATIRNVSNGASVSAGMAEGGFDPVAIEAAAGDTLAVRVLRAGGADTVLLLAVPVVRRPKVVRTDPPHRKRDVPLNAAAVIVFSEPIAPASAAGIRLFQGTAPVAGSIVVSPDGLRAEFTPAAALAVGATYQILVPSSVTDADGESLDAEVLVSFSTGAQLAVASVTTDPVALFVRPSTGELRSFDMSATLFDDGQVSGSFTIFYPETGRLLFGSITCFTLRDSVAWLGGTIGGGPDPKYIGGGATWLAVDHRGSAPDQLSLVTIDSLINNNPAVFCDDAPFFGTSPAIPLFDIQSGDVIIDRTGVTPPPPASGISEIASWFYNGIQLLRSDGSGGRALTHDPGDWKPAWSPDGSRLVFQSTRGQPGNWDLWIINADGSGLRRLTNGPEDDQDPAWSPDGSRLVFKRDHAVHVMNADGSGISRLTNANTDSHPQWSPDGRRIVFASLRSGTQDILVMNADGTGVTALTADSARDYDPTWSPDGSRIAFAHVTGGPDDGVFIMNADGSGRRQLTRGINGPASWSPDGSRLAYELYGTNVINVDGSGLRKIGNGFDPAWSPVGTMPPAPAPFRSLELVSGDGQSATVESALPAALTVRVVGDNGAPQPGVFVRWNIRGPATPGQRLSAGQTLTDASGVATVSLTLGSIAGPILVRAAVTDGTTRIGEVVFRATGLRRPPGPPVILCCNSALGFQGPDSSIVTVSVTDSANQGVTGVAIVWAVNNGHTIRSSHDTTRLSADGRSAYAQAVVGFSSANGLYTVTATAPTMPGVPRVSLTGVVVSAVVLAGDDYFYPDTVIIAPGQAVAWLGADYGTHNVTFEDGPTEPTSSPNLLPGESHVRTFTGSPRTIRYRCTLHSTGFTNGQVGIVVIR